MCDYKMVRNPQTHGEGVSFSIWEREDSVLRRGIAGAGFGAHSWQGNWSQRTFVPSSHEKFSGLIMPTAWVPSQHLRFV